MATVTYNLRAGTCVMQVTDRSRVLTHQVEAHSDAEAMLALIREAVGRLVEAHAKGTQAKVELAAANRIVSAAEYVAPEVAA